MRLSNEGECRPVSGPCSTSLDCDASSVCLAGRCEPGHRFRRLEVFIDGVPIALGHWSVDTDSYSNVTLASGNYSLRGGAGVAARASWALHPRWSLGGYLAYFRAADGRVDVNDANTSELVSRAVSMRVLRLGGLVNVRWSAFRVFSYGVGLETGLLLGTGSDDDRPFGLEIAPDFFFDIPLSSRPRRPYLTLSLGFRADAMDHHAHDVSGHPNAAESWYYFMPVIRLGVGVGH